MIYLSWLVFRFFMYPTNSSHLMSKLIKKLSRRKKVKKMMKLLLWFRDILSDSYYRKRVLAGLPVIIFHRFSSRMIYYGITRTTLMPNPFIGKPLKLYYLKLPPLNLSSLHNCNFLLLHHTSFKCFRRLLLLGLTMFMIFFDFIPLFIPLALFSMRSSRLPRIPLLFIYGDASFLVRFVSPRTVAF